MSALPRSTLRLRACVSTCRKALPFPVVMWTSFWSWTTWRVWDWLLMTSYSPGYMTSTRPCGTTLYFRFPVTWLATATHGGGLSLTRYQTTSGYWQPSLTSRSPSARRRGWHRAPAAMLTSHISALSARCQGRREAEVKTWLLTSCHVTAPSSTDSNHPTTLLTSDFLSRVLFYSVSLLT